jgi:hypothetical protein
MKPRTIREYLVRFEKHHWKGRSIDARRGYRNAIARYAVFLERDPVMSDLNADGMRDFDRWLQVQVAKSTREATIGKLRTLWNVAHADGKTSSGPPVVSQAQCGVARYYPGGGSARSFTVFTAVELSAIHEPERPPATLRHFIPRYAVERGIRPRTIACLHQRLGMFEKMLRCPAVPAGLNDTIINLWTAKPFEGGQGPVTVRGYRRAVLALWRAAYELHFMETRPGRIRKIRHKAAAPQCWTANQLLQVVDAFRQARANNEPLVLGKAVHAVQEPAEPIVPLHQDGWWLLGGFWWNACNFKKSIAPEAALPAQLEKG